MAASVARASGVLAAVLLQNLAVVVALVARARRVLAAVLLHSLAVVGGQVAIVVRAVLLRIIVERAADKDAEGVFAFVLAPVWRTDKIFHTLESELMSKQRLKKYL